MLRLRSFAVCLLATASVLALAQQALTNDSIIKMSKAGLGDDLIVQSINAQPAQFTTDASSLVTLKEAGVSERVIGAMMNRGATASTGTAAVATTNGSLQGVDEVGVYYKDHSGKWVQMEPEIINFKSGGALKSLATNGIIKQDRNGHINGEVSKLAVAKPQDFLLYVPEGTAPAEYQLLKLRLSKGTREFRSETGGVFHSSTGAERDSVPITPTKVAPRTYAFTVDATAEKGEYGILPPGSISTANAASGGKMYTFHIVE